LRSQQSEQTNHPKRFARIRRQVQGGKCWYVRFYSTALGLHNGYLFLPGYARGGITPGDWNSMVYLKQLVTEQQRQSADLEQRLKDWPRRRVLDCRPRSA